MGMASVFYDVLNKIVIDSSINPNSTSEKLSASQHLEHAGKNDLIIYDRGHMGFWFFALHLQQGSTFCMRAKTRQSLIVKDFIATNKKEAVVMFNPNKTSIKTCLILRINVPCHQVKL
jgi:hypothetical protein